MIFFSASNVRILSSFLGFIGSLILLKFGVSEVDTGGHAILVVSQKDEAEEKKIMVYRRWGKFGIFLISCSFILQFIGELSG